MQTNATPMSTTGLPGAIPDTEDVGSITESIVSDSEFLSLLFDQDIFMEDGLRQTMGVPAMEMCNKMKRCKLSPSRFICECQIISVGFLG